MMGQLIRLSLLLPLLVCGSSDNLNIYGCSWTLNISRENEINAWQLKCIKDNDKLKLSFSCLSNNQMMECDLSSGNHYEFRNNCKTPCSGGSCNKIVTISRKGQKSDIYEIEPDDSKYKLALADIPGGQTGMFPMTNKTWIEALQYCRILRSTLVEITNQTVQDAVSNLINETDLQYGVWVGLERSIFGINTEWMWTSGSKSINPGWTSNRPIDPLNNHCGKVVLDGNQVKLVDENCHKSLPFICQDYLGKI